MFPCEWDSQGGVSLVDRVVFYLTSSRSLTLTLSLSLSLSHTLPLSLALIHSLFLSSTHMHSLTDSLALAHTHTLSLTLSLILSLTPTHTPTHHFSLQATLWCSAFRKSESPVSSSSTCKPVFSAASDSQGFGVYSGFRVDGVGCSV